MVEVASCAFTSFHARSIRRRKSRAENAKRKWFGSSAVQIRLWCAALGVKRAELSEQARLVKIAKFANPNPPSPGLPVREASLPVGADAHARAPLARRRAALLGGVGSVKIKREI